MKTYIVQFLEVLVSLLCLSDCTDLRTWEWLAGIHEFWYWRFKNSVDLLQFSFRFDNCHTFLCKWEIVFLVYTYTVCVTFWIHVHIRKLKGFVVFKFLVPNMLIPCSRSGLANLRHACPEWHAERLPWRAVPIFFLFLLPSQSLYIVNNVYVCVCVCVCVCVYTHTHTDTHIWLCRDCTWNTIATI
jgi:hypothetical protein